MKWSLVVLLGWAVGCAGSNPEPETTRPTVIPVAASPVRWLGAWATAPQQVEDGADGKPDNRPPRPPGLEHNTLRQIILPTIGGSKVRLELSNQWGESPLDVDAVHLAYAAAEGRIDATSVTPVTFDGNDSVTIGARGTVWSDPIAFPLSALEKLAITIVFGARVPSVYTGHPGSRTDSYLQPRTASAAPELDAAVKTEHWYYITKLEVETSDPNAFAIVAFGDSITDGRGSTSHGSNLDQRWTDHLARRLQANPATRDVSVLNLGIGGNKVNGHGLGPSGRERFVRDVLGQSGVKWVVILHGINDIGADGSAAVAPLVEAYEEFTRRSKQSGVRVVGALLLPFEGSTYAQDSDHVAAHRSVNAWIRTSGTFDAVIDFEQAVGDPANPTRLKASFQQDGLHPTAELYQAMANAIDTSMFH